MKLDKRIYKYIEYELYNYNNSKESLEEMKRQIIETSGSNDGQPRGNEVGSQTENKAIKIMTSTTIASTERIIKAIEDTLKELEGTYRKLFEMKYCKKTLQFILKYSIILTSLISGRHCLSKKGLDLFYGNADG